MKRREWFSRYDVKDMIRREFSLPDDAQIEWESDGGGVVAWEYPSPKQSDDT